MDLRILGGKSALLAAFAWVVVLVFALVPSGGCRPPADQGAEERDPAGAIIDPTTLEEFPPPPTDPKDKALLAKLAGRNYYWLKPGAPVRVPAADLVKSRAFHDRIRFSESYLERFGVTTEDRPEVVGSDFLANLKFSDDLTKFEFGGNTYTFIGD